MSLVVYNKDLFTKYEVPLPEDGMSWDSLLQLAARFPTSGTSEERIYGIKTNPYIYDLFHLGTSIGSTLGSWKAVLETSQKVIQSIR
ncbi:hypothetical protein [Cohnella silvisoli]|uniref:Uncharacterized protein n=1 Tax=Cohnella silvisoli TaxID=2873699 RepID=A0ABV1L1Y9_9BACL|nr:hypothetical protein [Cohnella silvisoli]MCD9025964.1 hypothetical protein [Cohnella silvisoli]